MHSNGVQAAEIHREDAKFSIPILVVAPRQDDCDLLNTLLETTAWEPMVLSWDEACAIYRRSSNPILVCDLDLDGRCWREMVHHLRALRSDACVVFLADNSSAALREEAMHAGAFDLLARPFRREDLLLTLLFAYSHCRAHWPKNSPRRAFQPVVCANVPVRGKGRLS